MKLLIKKDFDRYTKGQIVTVKSVKKIPVDIYWRRRLKDAEIDGCVEVVKSKKRSK
jgi:hypothetical protein